jgi:BlaI family transcriptional regulator, penicillinase repressor
MKRADPVRGLGILTRAELEVMKVLWRQGESTVHDVVDALPRQVAYTTALTMLRILEQKGYAVHVPNPAGGRAHLYRPVAAEESVRRSHVRDLVDRVFGGRAEELVTGLLRDEKLTRAELESLRARIDSRLAAVIAKNKGRRP